MAERNNVSLFVDESLYRYLRRDGLREPRELEQLCSESRRHLSNTHFFLAIEALSQGDRETATRYFQNCLDDGHFMLSVYWSSRAFLAELGRDGLAWMFNGIGDADSDRS